MPTKFIGKETKKYGEENNAEKTYESSIEKSEYKNMRDVREREKASEKEAPQEVELNASN